jgi:signal transduction histidine kinase
MVFLAVGLVIGAGLAWQLGVKRGRGEVLEQVGSLAEGLRAGNVLNPGRSSPNEASQLRELREVLSQELARESRGQDDEAWRALSRIAQYLRHRVESPLLEGLDGGVEGLRSAADEALGAVEDLEFFLEDPPPPQEPATQNLADLVHEVTREFAEQSPVLVKVRSPQAPIRVRVEAEAIKDAIFLILHNGGEFGGGHPVDLTLSSGGGKAHLFIKDRGPGFSAEALIKAMDPFYSTSPAGLGLGLPHARRALNGQGGEVFLRNGENGGAEVEIRLPLAD